MYKQFGQRGFQGDVQIRRISVLPNGLRRVANRPVAFGEKSGHMHVVCGENLDVMEDPLTGHMYYSIGEGGAVLSHIHESTFKGFNCRTHGVNADHPAIEFSPDTYEFWIQTEYNPYTKLFQTITD